MVRAIQGDLPVAPNPFALLAAEIGIGEAELLERIRKLKERGIIRRFGATLRHQEAGFSSNAMAAWKVPERRIDDAGEILAGFREVTHCYHRRASGDWPYNLYAMIHGNSREQCRRVAEKMAQAVGIEDYVLLFSDREFKKTSMQYF